MKKILEKIEYWHNRASDTTFVWFPFLFLKPDASTIISQLHILKMTFCFSLYFNAAYLIKRYALSEAIDPHLIMKSQILWAIGFYCWFNGVTAFFWNRRAQRIK